MNALPPLAFALLAASPALAQMDHLSVSRSVGAEATIVDFFDEDFDSSTSPGPFNTGVSAEVEAVEGPRGVVTYRSEAASQVASHIGPDALWMEAELSATVALDPDEASGSALAGASMSSTFTIDQPTPYQFIAESFGDDPFAGDLHVGLFHEDEGSVFEFEFLDEPVALSGVLEPGTYSFLLMTSLHLHSGQTGSVQTGYHVGMAVPAPSTALALLPLGAAAVRRRR